MNYPATSSGVSSKALNAPRGWELISLGLINPYPPQVGLPASGGLVRLWRI